ncbi:oligosaccharide flippase family protein [Vibrio alginolyticus]|nr:oligosaccharide flippase family protein [Vibrio alginolyticus]
MAQLLLKFLLGKLTFSVLSLTLTLTLIRTLSEDDFGKYSLFFSLISLISVVFYGWARLAFTRKYINLRSKFSLINCCILNGKSTIILILLSFITCILYHIVEFDYIYLFLFVIPITIGLTDFFNEINRVEKKSITYSVVSAIRVFVTFFLLCFFSKIKGESLSIADVIEFILFSSCISLFFSSALFYKATKYRPKSVNVKLDKILFRYGFPLSASLIVSFLIFNSDKYLITYFYDTSTLGRYSSVQMLVQFGVNLLLSTFSLVWNPHIFKVVKETGVDKAIAKHRKNSINYLYFFLVSSVFVFFIGHWLFSVFGIDNEFSGSLELLLIFASFFFVYFKVYYLDLFYQITNETRIIFYNNIILFILNMIIGLLLIPIFGAIGGAISTLLSSFILVVYIVISINRRDFSFS